MIIEDQSRVIAFLELPSTHGGAPVERIDTHASIVFLAGPRAYKLKRAVRYDYLDFSSAERRREMCEAEVRINRRTAPGLYLGVVAVTQQPNGALALGGDGTPIEWLVEMARFDQAGLFDRLADEGELRIDLMEPLAVSIARFHAHAEHRIDCGGLDGMTRVVEGNATGLAREAGKVLDATKCAQLTHCARFTLGLSAVLLDSRQEDGYVRHCHGDLRLRNVVLIDGRPTLFDAIEFNDDIAWVDVLYDVAYLLMDLWHRRLLTHANLVWNTYLDETHDFDGLRLMPLFLSCRAAGRAKTTATAAALEPNSGGRRSLEQLARDYLDLAAGLLHPPSPRLIAIGGPSGSGKSTLAKALAPLLGGAPGAVVIRTDTIRKQLCGVKPHDRLGPAGHTDAISQRVYQTVMERADTIVRSGHAAVVDAVFARQPDRDAIQHIAANAGVPFTGLWLDAPESVLISRIRSRVADASDADPAVIRQQLASDLGRIHWHRLDASGRLEPLTHAAREWLCA